MKVRSITLLALLWCCIKWIWGFVILGIVVGVLGNYLYTYLTTGRVNFADPRTLPLVSVLRSHPYHFALILVLVFMLTLFAYLADRTRQKASRRVTVRPVRTASIQDRHRLLTKVHAFWITNVLEESLHNAVLIRLGLHKQPDAVTNPWHLVLQQSNESPRPLPPGTHITQVYDRAGGQLLILGEPGSGKTTLLLELCRDLLNRTKLDDTHPMPVIFNLSSWAVKRQPIADWLVEELRSKYQVSRWLGQSWVDADQILPLLDGLDEVASPYRVACVEAINAYRQEHGLLPTVMCSRREDYLAEAVRVLLSTAVIVQPLTPQQVEDYLSSAGEQLTAVREAFRNDSALYKLFRTPLMLSLLTLAYSGIPTGPLLTASSLVAQWHQTFTAYVQRMLQPRGTAPPYTPKQTMHWLVWLAKQQRQRSQTEFYIERMQPDWLPKNRSRWFYWGIACLVELIVGLIVVLYIGLLFVSIASFDKSANLSILWHVGLIFIAAGGLLVAIVIRVKLHVQTEMRLYRGLVKLIAGLIVGATAGLFGGSAVSLILAFGSDVGLINGLVAGLVFGLLVWPLVSVFVGLQIEVDTEIKPAEVVAWTWKDMRLSFAASFKEDHLDNLKEMFLRVWLIVVAVLSILLAGGLAIVDNVVPAGNSKSVLDIILGLGLLVFGGAFGSSCLALASWFTFGLVDALGKGMVGGFSSKMLDEHNFARPNQGIRRSARNSVFVGLISILGGGATLGGLMSLTGGLLGLLIGSLVGAPISRLAGGLLIGLFIGLFVGPVFGIYYGLRAGLLNGGLACIQHIVLRLLLWRTGSIPRNYPRFLDFAAKRILLRKVGGGYIFIHGLLLDYFASLEITLGSSETAENIQKPGDQTSLRLFNDLQSPHPSSDSLDRRFLEDVLELALKEARGMHKDYLGTPHLFIALIERDSGYTQEALRKLPGNFSAEQVCDVIRLALGDGKATSDTPILPTQRCKEILQTAKRNALAAGSSSINECAIAQAVLEERDGATYELLTKMGIQPDQLMKLILQEPTERLSPIIPPDVRPQS